MSPFELYITSSMYVTHQLSNPDFIEQNSDNFDDQVSCNLSTKFSIKIETLKA